MLLRLLSFTLALTTLIGSAGARAALNNAPGCQAKFSRGKIDQPIAAPALPLAAPELPLIPGAVDFGPRLTIAADAVTRSPEQIETLTYGQYNIENFLEMVGKSSRNATNEFSYDPASGKILQTMPPLQKPQDKVQGVADTILRANPDMMTVEEIESEAALEELNEKYLGGKYKSILIPGNDTRGINVGFLIRSDLPFDLVVQSYKNVAQPQGDAPIFSRDLPVIELRVKGAPVGTLPIMSIIGTHFKSQRDESGHDPLGANVRAAQVRAAAKIIESQLKAYGPKYPIFMSGDFNRDIRTGPEFKPLWEQVGFKDAFDMAPADHTVALNDRVTQTFHPRDGPRQVSQLDSISGSPGAQDLGLVRSAEIMPYLDANGRPKPLPETFDQREQNPSDHFMVKAVLDFQKLFASWKVANAPN